MQQDINIRQIEKSEYYLVKEFTYHAIFQRDKENLIGREVLDIPEIKGFYDSFGKTGDHAFVATDCDKFIAVCWCRIICGNTTGYGNIDSCTPELGLSVISEYRKKGIGKKLLLEFLEYLKNENYSKVSLSVQKDNYALNLYQHVGFKIIKENKDDYIMVKSFNE